MFSGLPSYFYVMLLKDPLLPCRPRKIISLVPSLTELLSALGLDAEVTGITKFCIHPGHWRQQKSIIGGTKNIRLQLIDTLQPDLVIANREENRKEDVDRIAGKFPVWVTDVHDLQGALEMIRDIGNLTDTRVQAENICRAITHAFSGLQPLSPPLRTAYLIWREPYMTAGGDTFIHSMLVQCGFNNLFSQRTRYPATTLAELEALDCELLLLSSEPYPFTQQHLETMQAVLPRTRIRLADGEMFSWYGSRLQQSAGYFRQLIAPLAPPSEGINI